jgi:hypothetical protein
LQAPYEKYVRKLSDTGLQSKHETLLPNPEESKRLSGSNKSGLRVDLSFSDSQYYGLEDVGISIRYKGELQQLVKISSGKSGAEYEKPEPVYSIGGTRSTDETNHSWSLVKINGPLLRNIITNKRSLLKNQLGYDIDSKGYKSLLNILNQNVWCWVFTQGHNTLKSIAARFDDVKFTDPLNHQADNPGYERLREEYGIDFHREDGKTPGEYLSEILGEFVESATNSLVDFLDPARVSSLSRLRPGSRPIYLEENISPRLSNLLRSASRSSGLSNSESRWLEEFGIGTRLNVDVVGGTGYVIEAEQEDGSSVPVSNLGDGASQVLPLILHLIHDRYTRYKTNKSNKANKPRYLLLDEPEARLHPDFQSKLADLLISIIQTESETSRTTRKIRSKVGLLVETHSEYLIRRLQLLVARGRVSTDDILIYYLSSDPEDENHVRKIKIDSHGQLSQPFGSGFFDQSTNLMVDLFKYGSNN